MKGSRGSNREGLGVLAIFGCVLSILNPALLRKWGLVIWVEVVVFDEPFWEDEGSLGGSLDLGLGDPDLEAILVDEEGLGGFVDS